MTPKVPATHARWIPLTFTILCVSVVLLANIQAWSGYFQGDDLDTLGWTRFLPITAYLKEFASPLYNPRHFRPTGHVIYWLLQRSVGLNFYWFLGVLQLLHLLNIWLVWRLVRQLGGAPAAAGSGALFFSFHMATIDAYWKPQFLFDVLCATFSLSSILLFGRRRFIPSFLCFWLAYKAKELAVMLPFVLWAYEYWFGERRWKPLTPFLSASLSFGLQGAVIGRATHAGTIYALHFTWKALVKTSAFYFSKIFLARYLGFAVLSIPLFLRDRKVLFGLSVFCLFLVPLLPMPDRLVDVYLYLPLAGLSVVAAALAGSRRGAIAVSAFCLIWISWNYLHSRSGRRYELAAAAENRAYTREAQRFAQAHANTRLLVCGGWPPAIASWGALGAFRLFYRDPIEQHSFDEAAIDRVMRRNPVVAEWHSGVMSLSAATPAHLRYLRMTDERTVFQLLEGWGQITNYARWIFGTARAIAYDPAEYFECTTRLQKLDKGSSGAFISVLLNGRALGIQQFRSTGEQLTRWPIPAAERRPSGSPITIEFRVQSGSIGPVAQVVSFGFVEASSPSVTGGVKEP